MLIDVKSLPGSVEVVVVPLSTMGDLVEVARRLEAPILHETGTVDSYGVIDNGVLYTYRPVPRRPRVLPEELADGHHMNVEEPV